MDINMPGMDGIEATQLIKKLAPASRVLGVSLHSQPSYARKMMQSGAMGYVTKNSTCDEMFRSVLEVHSGKRYICDEIKNILSEQVMCSETKVDGLQSLSAREIEIMDYIRKGNSSKEIAAALSLSVKTVEVHRYHILKKLNLKNTVGLVNFLHNNATDFVN